LLIPIKKIEETAIFLCFIPVWGYFIKYRLASPKIVVAGQRVYGAGDWVIFGR